MKPITKTIVLLLAGLAGGLGLLSWTAPGVTAQTDDQAQEAKVRIAHLIYAKGKTSVCFADDFLDTVARNTDINIARELDAVKLESDELFAYPMVIMTGEDKFKLTDAQLENLKDYIDGGGFVLASAGCSNTAWSRSFKAVLAELFEDEKLEALELDHPVFHSIYDIDRIDLKKSSGQAAILGMVREDRLRIMFSPMGLNDTANAGDGCCCCGGNEIKNARQINANTVAYALTH